MNGSKLGILIGTALMALPSFAVQQTFEVDMDAGTNSVLTGSDCTNVDGKLAVVTVGRVLKPEAFLWRFLARFDLQDSIPHGSTINSAILFLFVEQLDQANRTVEVQRVANHQWQDTAVTWDAYDCDDASDPNDSAGLWCGPGANAVGTDLGTTTTQWTIPIAGATAVDVKPFVERAVDKSGSLVHLRLSILDDESGSQRWVKLRTLDHADPTSRPQLFVDWTPPTSGSTPDWVTFRDETAMRLSATTQGPETNLSCGVSPGAGWMTCDKLEKDITVGDFDLDGDPDILIARKQPFSTLGAQKDILLRNEDGKLVDRTWHIGNTTGPHFFYSVESDARDVISSDFDLDGDLDLVMATTCDDEPKFYDNHAVNPNLPGRCAAWPGFWENSANWAPASYHDPILRFCAVAAGDVNDDGKPDLYFANYAKGCIGGPGDPVLLNDFVLINGITGSSGGFLDQSSAVLGVHLTHGDFGTTAEFFDVDSDGKEDDILLVRGGGGTSMYVENQTGPAYLGATPTDFHNVTPYMGTIGDLDNDGVSIDTYVVSDGTDRVYIGDHTKNPPTYPGINAGIPVAGPGTRTAVPNGNVKAANVDGFLGGDTDADIGVADVDVDFADSCNWCQPDNRCSEDNVPCTFPNHDECAENNVDGPRRTFALLRNNGSGTMSDVWDDSDNQNIHMKTYDFAFLDLNQDGCLDLFMGLCRGYQVMIQECPPTGSGS